MRKAGQRLDGHPVERARPRLLEGRRLRVPPGQRSALPDRRRAARHHPGAGARQPAPQRSPVHHAVESEAGALRRQVPDHGRGAGADRHRDGVVDHRVRWVPVGDVQPPAVWPARGRGARQHRLRRLLPRAGRGHRAAGAAARRHSGDVGAAERRVRVRESRPRAAPRRPHHQPRAARARAAAGEDAIRTAAAGRERRHLFRSAHRGHAGGAAGTLRARSRVRDRERLSGARRDGARLSVDCRQRSQLDDAPLLRLVEAHERGRSAARRRGRQLQGADRRHHAHLSGGRTVHAAAARDLRAGPRRAGCRHEGRADRREDARHRARLRGGHQGRPAQTRASSPMRPVRSSARGTRTASAIGSAWMSTTSATTSGRSRPGWRS